MSDAIAFSVGLIVGTILVWRYDIGERAYRWLRGRLTK